MDQEKIRLFIAIEFPQVVKDELARIQGLLKKQQSFTGNFVTAEQLHVTVKFIGEVDAEKQKNIENALRVFSFTKMNAKIGNLDVFQERSKIKVIFAQLRCPDLKDFAQAINEQLKVWCVPKKRVFVSHITLARVQNVADAPVLMEVLNKIEVKKIAFTIDSFVLKESILHPEGAIHTKIKTYHLV